MYGSWKSQTGVLAIAALAVAASTACMRGTAGRVPGGSELYAACASCHGTVGQGNQSVGAPRIAGMPAWYVSSQLKRFQGGLRGKHPDDMEGLRMRAMSKQMLSDAEVDAVASHVAALPKVTNAGTFRHTDKAVGQQLFAVCSSCHGLKGEGNEAVKAPPLAGIDDWYAELQLRKFRAGIRGKAAGDPVGPIMQGMSMTIPADALDDIAAYVHGLGQ
jgi:cytochrome c553